MTVVLELLGAGDFRIQVCEQPEEMERFALRKHRKPEQVTDGPFQGFDRVRSVSLDYAADPLRHSDRVDQAPAKSRKTTESRTNRAFWSPDTQAPSGRLRGRVLLQPCAGFKAGKSCFERTDKSGTDRQRIASCRHPPGSALEHGFGQHSASTPSTCSTTPSWLRFVRNTWSSKKRRIGSTLVQSAGFFVRLEKLVKVYHPLLLVCRFAGS